MLFSEKSATLISRSALGRLHTVLLALPALYVASLFGCSSDYDLLAELHSEVSIPSPIVRTTTGTVGTIPGVYETTGDGAATYRIPLEVPAGRAGVAPTLALAYSSRVGNGTIGVGWQLSGLSQITRCPSTWHRDRWVEPINFVADPFCLDGVRLVRISASGASVGAKHCAAGAKNIEYRTEPESFRRVIACDQSLGAPTSWIVYDKTGSSTHYGSSDNGRLEVDTSVEDSNGNVGVYVRRRIAWLADRVEDVVGNTMMISYGIETANDRLEWWPARIDYTGFAPSNVPGTRRVVFEYEGRPDAVSTYQRGIEIVHAKRLKAITMYAPEAKDQTAPLSFVRRYALAYRVSEATGRSVLDTVELCNGFGECLPRTILRYGPWTPTFASRVLNNDEAFTAPGVLAAESGPPGADWLTLDANGDGRDDISGGGGVSLSNGDSLAGGFVPVPHDDTTPFLPFPYDIGSDRNVDLVYQTCAEWVCTGGGLCNDRYCREWRAQASVWTGDGTYVDAGTTQTCGGSLDGLCELPLSGVGDLNGDLKPDVANLNVYQLSFRDAIPAKRLTNPLGHDISTTSARFIDIDGDGALDILWPRASGYDAIHLRGAPATASVFATATNFPPNTDSCDVFADVNGDGLTDVATFRNANEVRVRINRGDGRFMESALWASVSGVDACAMLAVTDFPELGYRQLGVHPVDYNHDGLQDLLVVRRVSGATHAKILISTGTAFQVAILPVPFTIDQHTCATVQAMHAPAQPLDIDGDGLFDILLLCRKDAHTRFALARQQHVDTATAGRPDLLFEVRHEIRDDLGVLERHIEYGVTTDPEVYTPEVIYGARWMQPLVVVKGEWIDRGDGGYLKVAHHTYRGGALTGDAEGWLGFSEHKVTDPRTNATHVVRFATAGDLPGYPAGTAPVRRSVGTYLDGRPFHPFAGRVVENEITTPVDGTRTLFRRTRTIPEAVAIRYPSGVPNYFVFARFESEESYDTGEQLASRLSTTTVDVCGNPQTVLVDRNPGASPLRVDDTRYTHIPALSAYNAAGAPTYCTLPTSWIDFVSFIETTSTVGASSQVRQTQFVAETDGTGRVKDAIVQPNADADEKLCSRIVTRDVYGTPTIVDVTPNTCPVRTTGDLRLRTRRTRTTFNIERFTGYDDDPGNDLDVYEGIYAVEISKDLDPTIPISHVTKQSVHPGLGVTYAVEDPNNQVTAFNFDAFGRPRRVDLRDDQVPQMFPSRNFLRTDYLRPDHPDASPCLAGDLSATAAFRSVERVSISGGMVTLRCFDRLGRLAREVTKVSDADWAYVDTTFFNDFPDRTYEVTRPRRLSEPRVIATQNAYDNAGRVVSVSSARPSAPTELAIRRFQYEGRAIDTCEPRTPGGDELYQVHRRKVMSKFGTVEATSVYDDATSCSGGTAQTTSYGYGPFDTLTSVLDAQNNLVSMKYDALGRQTELDDKDTGLVTKRYTAFGEVREERNARGQVTTLEYDSLGRLKTRSMLGENSDRFTYDPINGRGALGTSTRGAVSRSITYNGRSLPEMSSITVDGTTYETVTSFDSQGRIASTGLPAIPGLGLLRLVRDYDSLGRLHGLDLARESATCTATNISQCGDGESCLTELGKCGRRVWEATGIDAEGRVTDERFANGLRAARVYDGGFVRQMTVKTSAMALIQQLDYTYFDTGSLRTRRDAMVGATERFKYDGGDRLRSAQVDGQLEATYEYDAIGNLTYASDARPFSMCTQGMYLDYTKSTPWSAVGPHAATQGRCKGTTLAWPFKYDATGNHVGGINAGDDYRWTSFGKVSQTTGKVDTWQFTYDANHQRVMKRQTWSLYNPHPYYPWTKIIFADGLERRFAASGVQQYLVDLSTGSAPMQLIWDWNGTSGTQQLQYNHSDRLGSAVLVTDGVSGEVVEQRAFDVWGAQRAANMVGPGPWPTVTNVSFTGHKDDLGVMVGDGHGFVDMGGRIYSPLLKRFWSPDPTVQAPYYGPSWNRYSYTFNNPLKFVDPTGYSSWESSSLEQLFGVEEWQIVDVEGGVRDRYMLLRRVMQDAAGRVVVAPGKQGCAGGADFCAEGMAAPRSSAELACNSPVCIFLAREFGLTPVTIPSPLAELNLRMRHSESQSGYEEHLRLWPSAPETPMQRILRSVVDATPAAAGMLFLQFAGLARTGGVVPPAASEPGQWMPVKESMSARAAAYQARITGRPGEAYVVKGVKFDGFSDGILRETKGPGYERFVKDGAYRPWWRGADSLVNQAQRQLSAAEGVPIRWEFAEKAAANATRSLFQQRGVSGIDIVVTE